MNKKKKLIKFITVTVFIFTILIVRRGNVLADWVDPRDGVRPTQPSLNRDGRIIVIPTAIPSIQPTQLPIQPTATPKAGGPSVTPAPTAVSNGSSTDDPCASGKSYSGPYCGWSPGTGGSTGGSSGGSSRIGGGPQVLGLSYTAGDGISWSDIIFLTGILCLLLYARSKMSKEIRV